MGIAIEAVDEDNVDIGFRRRWGEDFGQTKSIYWNTLGIRVALIQSASQQVQFWNRECVQR